MTDYREIGRLDQRELVLRRGIYALDTTIQEAHDPGDTAILNQAKDILEHHLQDTINESARLQSIRRITHKK